MPVTLCACQSSVQTRIMTRLSPKCAAIYRYIMHACAETQDAVHQHQSGVSLPPRCLPRIPSLRRYPLLHATSPKQRSIQVTEVSPRHVRNHTSRFIDAALLWRHSQEQDRSHGGEGCGAPDEHQHRRPPAPAQETATTFQQALQNLVWLIKRRGACLH